MAELRKTIDSKAAAILKDLLEQAGKENFCVVTDPTGKPLARFTTLQKAKSAGAENGGFPGTLKLPGEKEQKRLSDALVKTAMHTNELGLGHIPNPSRPGKYSERYIRLITRDDYDKLAYLDKDKTETAPVVAKKRTKRKRSSTASTKKTTSGKNDALSDNEATPKKKKRQRKK